MVWFKIKWKLILLFSFVTFNVFECFPIGHKAVNASSENSDAEISADIKVNENHNFTIPLNVTRTYSRSDVRPGQTIRQYAVELTVNGNSFNGRVVMNVQLTTGTRDDPIVLHLEDLDVHQVLIGILSTTNLEPADFEFGDGILEIFPPRLASSYTVVVEYTGSLENVGYGFYMGRYPGNTYVAMNLHPTNARRVFPCLDEPTEASTISFTFNNLNYDHLVGNSMLEENSQNQFRALMGPPHVWGMVAHNFESMLTLPAQSVEIYGRTGLTNQDAQSTAISAIFSELRTWTNKDYLEIDVNQDGRMIVLALPDVDTEWSALSTVAVWEPYVILSTEYSQKHRSVGLVKVAEAIARQWFGYVVYPENWRYEWVVAGLGSYAAWDVLREYEQETGAASDISLLDINTLFVTEVIQESLLQDAMLSSRILEPNVNLFDVSQIRDHRKDVKLKSAALMRMLRLMLGTDQDYIKTACQSMLNSRSLQSVTNVDFYDAVNSEFEGNEFIDDIEEYMEQWLKNTGYPSIFVNTRGSGVSLNQDRFAFTPQSSVAFEIPITYTTSLAPDFDNLYPQHVIDGSINLDLNLGEDDWVVFNIQGQGYYRVNYVETLWERLIDALNDRDRRDDIHPLNRGVLIDDALNLARGTDMDYDLAFRMVLTMEHETAYAPWKAFVRNMDFLRKRLVAMVTEDEDLDPDIYLRMVRRTIGRVESELGFYPDPMLSEQAMVSLTRGLVMDHACRANYQPCIAAAVDWFYASGTDEPTVNPNIPRDIRPAVYCTMVREGDNTVIEALERRLEIEPTQNERVVIMESFGCSRDQDYINSLLESTISDDSPYLAEEKVRILTSVIESSYENAFVALNFISRRTNEIRNMYGGKEKLEELIYLLANNMANDEHATQFNNWRSDRNNNLDDSEEAVDRAYDIVRQNIQWDARFLNEVYEWIDENDAKTLAVSMTLLCITAFVTLFNH